MDDTYIKLYFLPCRVAHTKLLLEYSVIEIFKSHKSKVCIFEH